eukprot:758850-Amphidinium_carterae.2
MVRASMRAVGSEGKYRWNKSSRISATVLTRLASAYCTNSSGKTLVVISSDLICASARERAWVMVKPLGVEVTVSERWAGVREQ